MFQILLQEYECICLLLKVEYECICLLLKVITTLADASTAIEKRGQCSSRVCMAPNMNIFTA